MSGDTAAPTNVLTAPNLRRRLACFAYEGVLLFGVCFFVGLIYGLVIDQRHALYGRSGLVAMLFLMIGLYFVGYWSRTGQTLPMQTWRIRVVDASGGIVSPWRALRRYLLSYVWLLPPLAFSWLAGGPTLGRNVAISVPVWIVVYAALARLKPGHQFPHDLLSGTRLVRADAKP